MGLALAQTEKKPSHKALMSVIRGKARIEMKVPSAYSGMKNDLSVASMRIENEIVALTSRKTKYEVLITENAIIDKPSG